MFIFLVCLVHLLHYIFTHYLYLPLLDDDYDITHMHTWMDQLRFELQAGSAVAFARLKLLKWLMQRVFSVLGAEAMCLGDLVQAPGRPVCSTSSASSSSSLSWLICHLRCCGHRRRCCHLVSCTGAPRHALVPALKLAALACDETEV
jgi:hypothetical protein